MREIKFRSYDRGMMFYSNSYSNLRTFFDNHREDCGEILMQFTGLKDKTGREIYEKDVLLIDGNNCIIEFGECTRIKFCIYKHWIEQDFNFPLDSVDLECGEIIGNIYQNPELLEAQE